MKHQDFIIAVITRGRVDTQVFLENVPEHIRSLVTLCCHPGELQMHKKRWGNRLANIIEYGKDCTNLGEARHWLMEYCRQNSISYAIQVDDNVRFAARVNRLGQIDFDLPLLNLTNNFNDDLQSDIIVEMFSRMIYQLSTGYGMVGISHRSGNNRKKQEVEDCARLFGIWGINVKKYFNLKYRFYDNPYKEDFHMQLAFLTSGIPTCCNNSFTFDKSRSNSNGGCSIYRNLENVNKGSELLHKFFPQFVNLVDKDCNHWDNLGEGTKMRKETVIQWKKAYQAGLKNKHSNG